MTARRRSVRMLAFALTVALCSGTAVQTCLAADQAAPQAKPVTAQQFETIAARLDTGGDVYMIVNVEGLVKGLMDTVARFVSTLAAGNPADAQTANDTVAKLQAFLDGNGMYALQGFGMSSVPHPDGMYTLKMFVTRDPAAQEKPFWRAIVGTKPRRLASLDFLPADAALARACNAEPAQLWQLVKTGVNQVLPPQPAGQFNKFCADASAKLGVEVDKLMDSLGDDSFLSIQLSPTNVLTIPARSGPITIPEPSFVLGCKLSNNTLPDTLDTLLATNKIPVVKLAIGNDVLRTIVLPMTIPIKWQPAYTTHAGYLLVGSTADAVIKAVQAFDTKNGLVATPEFIKAFEGLPMVNNGLEYVSPRFTKAIADFQTRVVDAQSAAMPAQAALSKATMDLLRKSGTESGAFVILNLQSGILVQGTSSASGKEVLAGMVAAPIGLMAGIAIPSFVKARGTAQHNACINNLRMIDAAKEQWALEQGKAAGSEVDVEAMKKYLRGGAMPACPNGGVYTINAIGTNPECSIPGHRLLQPARVKSAE